jgi:hypothetical protein
MSLPVGQSWTGRDEFMSLVPPHAAGFLHPHNALPSCHRPVQALLAADRGMDLTPGNFILTLTSVL